MNDILNEARRRLAAGEIGVTAENICLVCRGGWDRLEQVPSYYIFDDEVCDLCRKAVSAAYRNEAFAKDPPRGVPSRHRAATIATLLPEVANAVGGVYLWGGVGRGKSWQAVALLKKRWMEAFQTGRFMTYQWWQEAMLAEASRNSVKDGTTQFMQNALVACDILVIDDIGTARTTEFAKEQLLMAISQRYDMEKPCIFTSNLSLGGLAERMSEGGSDQTGDRIASRISETCAVVHVEGPDRRLA